MRQSTKFLMFVAVMTLGVVASTSAAPSAEAAVYSTGNHYACYDGVAVREFPDGPARDNLKKGQTFVVTSSVGGNYVYGYKLVNSVHGWVKSSSIDKSCKP